MIAALLLLLAGSGAAPDPAATPDPFEGLEAMGDAALDEARGGFSIGGFDIAIGVTVSVNGQVEHVLTSDAGALRTALDAAGLPPDRYDVATDGRLVTIVRNGADGAVLSQEIVLDVVIGEASPGLLARPAAPRADLAGGVRLIGD